MKISDLPIMNRKPKPKPETPKTIELSEHTATHGCHYSLPGEKKIYYGFDALPHSASLWLYCVSGDAVNQIIEAGLGEVIKTTPGAYGGTCKTVRVDVQTLETHCRAYWDRANRAHEKHQESLANCHYCGAPAIGIGFFGEGVCKQCGG